MKEQMGRILATGAIIGGGAFGADNHTVSAGGGEGHVDALFRETYDIWLVKRDYNYDLKPFTIPETYEVDSKTKGTIQVRKGFPFVRLDRSGKIGIQDGIKEIKQEGCKIVAIERPSGKQALVKTKNGCLRF